MLCDKNYMLLRGVIQVARVQFGFQLSELCAEKFSRFRVIQTSNMFLDQAIMA